MKGGLLDKLEFVLIQKYYRSTEADTIKDGRMNARINKLRH